MEKKYVMGMLLDADDLQNYQDIFSEAQRVFMKCYDADGKAITSLSGRQEDIERLYENVGEAQLTSAMEQAVAETGSRQELLWKDTACENVKIVAVPNNKFGRYEGLWLLIVLYRQEEYADQANTMPTKGMYTKVTKNGAGRAIRLLELFVDLAMMAAHDNTLNHEKLRQITQKDDVIEKELKRKEVITNILQVIESDEEIEQVIGKCIGYVSEYLQISMMTVVKVNEKDGKIETIGKWCDESVDNSEEIINRLPLALTDICRDEAVLIVEKPEEHERLKELLGELKIRSMITIPIITEKMPEIYAIFAETRHEKKWDTYVVKFLFEVTKLLQDFIYKRITKNSLISSYTALKEILNNLFSGIIVIDNETGKVLFINDTVIRKIGKSFIDKNVYSYIAARKKVDSEETEEAGERLAEQADMEARDTGRQLSIGEKGDIKSLYYIEKYDEVKEKWYDIYFNPISWVDGKKVTLCNLIDITEKKKYQQKIEFQANNDFLTGLYNRMKCEEDLQFFIKEAERINSKGALLFIDLDNFKHINDGLGHQFGDLLLKMIAASLQRIRGIENKCYRVGGDEFIVIIEPKIFEDYRRIIDDIQKVFASPWYLGDTEYYCTMSMGVVTFPDRGRNVNDLVKKADIAMYDTKKNGKNGFRYYSEGEDQHLYKRLDMEKNMRLAIEDGCKEFEVYIQPIVDTATEKCLGGEALVRWNSKNLGFLMPAEFIPIAEHMRLIAPIGEHVLRTACQLSRKWSDLGVNARINVNLSVIQLLANDVVDVIRKIVQDMEIIPERLVLEVTESLAINDMTRMKHIISEIKSMGIKIALDDFGTGYSSLNHIKQMDLDIIKVDRTFIKDIADDDYAQAFVKLIADLSRQLEVQVCVEGVEDIKQLETLRKLNINMIQGFYYGRPMRVKEFEEKFLKIKDGQVMK